MPKLQNKAFSGKSRQHSLESTIKNPMTPLLGLVNQVHNVAVSMVTDRHTSGTTTVTLVLAPKVNHHLLAHE